MAKPKPDPGHAGADIGGLIHQALADAQDRSHRDHLGCSQIGRPCEREVWYGWRWAKRPDHHGRLLRLFRRGQDEEEKIVADLRAIGLEVHDVSPKTKRQFTVSHLAGHIGGSLDGAGKGVPGQPLTWMVLEFKTSGLKSFNRLVKNLVEKEKPEHYVQMQLYMLFTGMKSALYLAVCKDNDEIHTELIEFDGPKAKAAREKAERIVKAEAPPPKIAQTSAWFQCHWCNHKDHCHGTSAPLPNCRTCTHAKPYLDEDFHGLWRCSRHGRPLSHQDQENGCSDHLYILGMLSFAEPVEADEKENFVRYQNAEGLQFYNGLADKPLELTGETPYSSREISELGSRVLTDDPLLESIRRHFGPLTIEQCTLRK
jgi:hypothetical protein